jgi:myo-inositol-1(or 4)-monophosphatase
MQAFLKCAVSAARRAGAALKERAGEKRTIDFKGEIDLVTEMDRYSEKLIVGELKASFPTHGILAEEGTRTDGSTNALWIIDPLDGTTNYAHGYPNFAVSIALEMESALVVGVVFDPLREELFAAVRGEGATMNGLPLHISSNELLLRSLIATGFPYDRARSRENNLDFFNAMVMACQEIRRSGSAALDLCSVAAGRLDGYWELKLKPWDVAAGILIVQEAGGIVSDLAGAPFSIREGNIAASNGLIHGQMLDILEYVERRKAEDDRGNQ